MKKLLLLFAVIAIMAGCSKNDAPQIGEDQADIWNGYEHYKYSTMTVDLVAGIPLWGWCNSQIVVGTAEYVFTDDAHFKVIYTLNDGWSMSNSYMYAGDYDCLPTGRWNFPRIWAFPHHTNHNPAVTEFSYSVPVVDLPPGETGFVVATYCTVKNGCICKPCWADGDRKFSCWGWGMYTSNYYEEALDIVVLYGIQETNDGTLVVTYINGSDPSSAEIILEESVATSGSVSSAAYDETTGNLYFTIGNQLYANNLADEEPTEEIGTLSSSMTGGGTFSNSHYYYYDNDPTSNNFEELIEVEILFDPGVSSWSVSENPDYSDPLGDYIEGLTITDLASYNNTIYLIGVDEAGTPADPSDDVSWLLSYNGTSWGQSDAPLNVTGDTQIAFGSDGQLYTFYYNFDEQPLVGIMDPETGDLDPIGPGDDEGPGGEVVGGDEL
jgi:hypothetical protein